MFFNFNASPSTNCIQLMFDSVNKHQDFFPRGPGIEPDPLLGWEFLQETLPSDPD